MDSKFQSPPLDEIDTKAAFRKPSSDAANRKYRRRSPVGGSSSSDGSPKHDESSSPINLTVAPGEVSEHLQKRKDGATELGKDSGWSRYGKSSDLQTHTDRHSSRSSYGYSRHDDYSRHDRYADDDHQRLSSRSSRDSRDEHMRESKYGRSRDYSRHVDKYSRDRYDGSGHRSKDKEKESSHLERSKDKDLLTDRAGSGRRHTSLASEDIDKDRHRRDRDARDEKKDYRRSSGACKGDRSFPYEESRGHHRNDSSSGRDYDGRHRKYDEWDTKRDRDQQNKAPDHSKDKSVFGSDNQEASVKRSKFSSSADYVKDVSKLPTSAADENQSSILKPAQETGGIASPRQVQPNGMEATKDLDAAKVAAMKAAELVNKNLVGTGFMSTEQKKKLLWGNKKSTAPEESGHHWDTAMFGDRERQEKFNKLMGVKGEVKTEHKSDQQDAAKQMELQMDLEKQYTAGLRRRDGRTVGLGL